MKTWTRWKPTINSNQFHHTFHDTIVNEAANWGLGSRYWQGRIANCKKISLDCSQNDGTWINCSSSSWVRRGIYKEKISKTSKKNWLCKKLQGNKWADQKQGDRVKWKPAVKSKAFVRRSLWQEVGQIFFLKFKMITNLLPADATHTTLDLLKKQPLHITFDNAFTQKVGPSYSPDGPMLEFEVLGDRNNFIDLQKLLLEIKCKLSRNNDGDLRTVTDAVNKEASYLSSNKLHSVFTECTLSSNDDIFSNTNGNYAHKAFIETEFLSRKTAKNTWLVCQG